jgi:ABC-type transport system involved in cytochrome bd biosynthesis fused ATPase/permease subunit
MIQGIIDGRIETIEDGTTTYVYKHKNHDAANADEDWDATRIITTGSNLSIVNRKGCFANYATEW